jgi:hypothetical protein
MPAINFMKRWAAPIVAGVKCSTIRPPRKDRRARARPGQELALYWGMRTKHCTLIGRARCVAVQPISMDMESDGEDASIGVVIDGAPLNYLMLEDLARQEGFRDVPAMAQFFAEKYGTQMAGEIITWADFEPAK